MLNSKSVLKWMPFLVMTALNLHALVAQAHEGGVSGGGGDASEARVNEIREDILNWISQGGAQSLTLPSRLNLEQYQSQMTAVLAPQAVVVSFVTQAQEAATTDPELKVTVDGQPKTCRGFISVTDQRPHVLCNTERFAATGEAEQYRLIHHEYAGLAGVELNNGAASDYEISRQLTNYLVPEIRLRLAVLPRHSALQQSLWGRFELVSDLSPSEAEFCGQNLEIRKSENEITLVNFNLISNINLPLTGDIRSFEYGISHRFQNGSRVDIERIYWDLNIAYANNEYLLIRANTYSRYSRTRLGQLFRRKHHDKLYQNTFSFNRAGLLQIITSEIPDDPTIYPHTTICVMRKVADF
jgi:hypothetical protein